MDGVGRGVEVAHTAQLGGEVLAAVRELLAGAFHDGFSDQDWDHALGGVHALAWDGGQLVGHGSVVQRRLLHAERALRVGYVEGVAVRAGHRRRGHGAAVVAALEEVVRRAYDAGALSTSEAGEPLYASRGWRVWRGPTSALTPAGVVATPDDDGSVMVLPAGVPLDVGAPLTCDWRDGDLW